MACRITMATYPPYTMRWLIVLSMCYKFPQETFTNIVSPIAHGMEDDTMYL